MSQDFALHFEVHTAYKKSYVAIKNILLKEGSDLSQFPTMPQISNEDDGDDDNDMLVEDHRNLGETQYCKLNENQKEIVDKIMNVMMKNNRATTCFYIDGPGGSGKTFIYTTLYHLLKSYKKKICTMAYTGIAAILLPHGKTVHRIFGLPVPLFNDSTSPIKSQSEAANYLRNIDTFIWDEAPMVPRYALDLVDLTLRDLMNVDLPFDGKIMVLAGDFRQLLPIEQYATRSEIVNLSIKFSLLWKHFVKFSLTQNMRTLPNKITFAKFLIDVGNGTLNDEENNMKIPQQVIANKNEDICESIYGRIIRKKRYEHLCHVTILAARNIDVDEINNKVVRRLDRTTERKYTSVDSFDNCDNGDISDSILPEYLNTLNPPNLPAHELKLRINCIVMLLRNLSINEGLSNGTRLQILGLTNNLLQCRILTGDKTGEICFINRITLYCENVYPFTFKRRQFPIKIAFTMTINKSHGQTVTKIGIDLRGEVFSHDQLYVALSQVRLWHSLKIFLGDQNTDGITKNYVYRKLYE